MPLVSPRSTRIEPPERRLREQHPAHGDPAQRPHGVDGLEQASEYSAPALFFRRGPHLLLLGEAEAVAFVSASSVGWAP